MGNIGKRRFFYYLVILILISSLLMIAHNNARRFLSYQYLWGPFFLLCLFIFDSKIYTDKKLLLVIFGGILYFGILQHILWRFTDDWYKNSLTSDFRSLLFSLSIYVYLKNNKYLFEWNKLAKIGFVFFLITGFMTIIATAISPLIVRASYSSIRESIEDYNLIIRLGFGSYGYMTALVVLLPILVYFTKQKKQTWLSNRILIIIIIFLYIVTLRAQIFANILIASVILILSFVGAKKFSITFFSMVVLTIIIFIIPINTWVESINFLSNKFEPNGIIHYKLNDMAIFIQDPVLEGTTGAGSRGLRYVELFNVFIKKPFLGDASYYNPFNKELALGGHLYWMSRLTLLGIGGFMAYLTIIAIIFKNVLSMFDSEFKYYYLLSILSVILLGLLKNIIWLELWLILLIIIPGLYFNKYLLQVNQKNKFVF
ncbi:hypothetical protein ACFLQ3_00950 [Bacteroidota bacterium]